MVHAIPFADLVMPRLAGAAVVVVHEGGVDDILLAGDEMVVCHRGEPPVALHRPFCQLHLPTTRGGKKCITLIQQAQLYIYS